MMSEGKERYLFIDGIRGIAVVNMVAFHFCYDVQVIYRGNFAWPNLMGVRLWQQFICFTFILVSGFVWRWGEKNNLRRGIFINLCGFLVTLATCLVVPDEAIWFGILNFIGCGILLMIPLDHVLKKVSPLPGILVCLAAFFLFQNAAEGCLGFGTWKIFSLPQWLYRVKILTPLGFPYPGFQSADYFPILPWIFLYLCGYFFQPVFLKKESWKKAARHPIPLLSAIGKKSILIYMLHQPLCMLVCEWIF